MPRDRLFDLDPLFNPASVAVVGASSNPAKLGFHVMKSLIQGGYRGRILPVNPSAAEIMGRPAKPSLQAWPEAVDLAVIVVPAGRVEKVLQQCRLKGVRGVVLITAGFREIDDPQGEKMQARLAETATRAGIPVVGPNTFGMVNRHHDLNASFTPEFSRVPKGGVALVSQSGGIAHLLAFLALENRVGMSKIVGLGNRLNLDFADLYDYLVQDPDTAVIALYLEGLDDPRELVIRIGRSKTTKPTLAYKTGRGTTGNAASRSHTGSLAGNAAIYQGALKQAGVLPLDSAAALLDAAKALSICPLPLGPRVAVLSGQAGPAMAACDVCEDHGLRLAQFEERTQRHIRSYLPPVAIRTNPVDMGPAWYDAEAIGAIVNAVAEDRQVDAIVLLMMYASANREALSALEPFFRRWRQKKPLITCLLAPPGIWDDTLEDLERSGLIVQMPTPERAALALVALWRYAALKTGRVCW